MVEHEIIRDHVTKRPRGFGFVVFDSDHVVDNVLANGNRIDMAGTQVSYWQQSFMVLAIYYGRLMYKGIFEGFPLSILRIVRFLLYTFVIVSVTLVLSGFHH